MGYSIFDETMVNMTWPEIQAAAEKSAIVLLPTGIIEEHGPHMGLAVDTYAAYLIGVLVKHELESRGIKTLIAPPQYWGVSPTTWVFPGTFSIRAETMKALIGDILASLKRWKLNKVFIINWHADMKHCQAILEAVKEAHSDMGIEAFYLAREFDVQRLRLTGEEEYVLQYQPPPVLEFTGKYVDIHAGSMETAVMMKYFPEHVKAALAKKLPPTEIKLEDLKNIGKSDEVTLKMTPDGYFGNPAGYDTGAAGKHIGAHVKATVDCIEGYLKGK